MRETGAYLKESDGIKSFENKEVKFSRETMTG